MDHREKYKEPVSVHLSWERVSSCVIKACRYIFFIFPFIISPMTFTTLYEKCTAVNITLIFMVWHLSSVNVFSPQPQLEDVSLFSPMVLDHCILLSAGVEICCFNIYAAASTWCTSEVTCQSGSRKTFQWRSFMLFYNNRNITKTKRRGNNDSVLYRFRQRVSDCTRTWLPAGCLALLAGVTTNFIFFKEEADVEYIHHICW